MAKALWIAHLLSPLGSWRFIHGFVDQSVRIFSKLIMRGGKIFLTWLYILLP